MARYRLTAAHYINSPGTEWEQKELNRDTGKEARKRYAVPLYLNPDDPGDCNYPGEVIITTASDPAYRRDIVVTGPNGTAFVPTPDMEPIDEEARAIVAKLRPKWEGTHPIESLPGQVGVPYGERLIVEFEARMTKLLQESGGAAKAPDPTVAELMKQIAALTAKVEELSSQKARRA